VYEEVYADHLGVPYRSITIKEQIHRRGTPEVHSFSPDIWCRYNNKTDVIEVWDEQSDDASVADVILPALVEKISTLSIICFDDETEKLAKKLSKVILSSVHNEGGDPLLPLSNISKYILRIPDDIQRDQTKMKDYFKEELNLKP
jgi:hypothetical protein